tara:strand:+ start:1901 stop:2185 length:285 start_codon:yes stop_codon:yes gene_type:complete
MKLLPLLALLIFAAMPLAIEPVEIPRDLSGEQWRQEAIIVRLSYSEGSKGTSSRIRDYTSSKAEDWKLATGEAANHARFTRKTAANTPPLSPLP